MLEKSHSLECSKCRHAGVMDGLTNSPKRRFEHQLDYDSGYSEGWSTRMKVSYA